MQFPFARLRIVHGVLALGEGDHTEQLNRLVIGRLYVSATTCDGALNELRALLFAEVDLRDLVLADPTEHPGPEAAPAPGGDTLR